MKSPRLQEKSLPRKQPPRVCRVMPVEFLDTNPIFRFLTRDNPDQGQRAYALFQQVETGTIIVTTCEGVIVESVQVLSSKKLYNLPRNDISIHLKSIISLKGLKLSNKRTYLRALDIYA